MKIDMDVLSLDIRQRQIAIESFNKTLKDDKRQYDSGLDAYYEARNKYLTLIKFCVEYSERSNALIKLIEEFGGQPTEEYVEFKLEEITTDNYELLLNGESKTVTEDVKQKDDKLNVGDTASKEELAPQRVPRKRGIKRRVIQMFKESNAPLSTGDIVEAIRNEFGESTPYQSISNTLIRLQRDSYLSKNNNGEWEVIRRFDNDGNRIIPAIEDFVDSIEDEDDEATDAQSYTVTGSNSASLKST